MSPQRHADQSICDPGVESYLDYVCVRKLLNGNSEKTSVVWIGHCFCTNVTNVRLDENKKKSKVKKETVCQDECKVVVEVMLHNSNMPDFPEDGAATVEIMRKALPNR